MCCRGVKQDLLDPDRALVLNYAPVGRREMLAALFALDEALGQALRGARDPMLGQMRLTWWHGALSGLNGGAAPSDPALVALLRTGIVPDVIDGATIATMVEGWEALLDDPVDAAALGAFARQRGGVLFRLGARILDGTRDAIEDAGAGWALVDLARHSVDTDVAARALAMAQPHLDRAVTPRWPVKLRALGALTALAARDAGRGRPFQPAGHPARMLRALRHRLTGR